MNTLKILMGWESILLSFFSGCMVNGFRVAPWKSRVKSCEVEAGEVHLRLVRLSEAIDEGASLFDLFDFDQSLSMVSELYDWEVSDLEFKQSVLDVCPDANSFSDLFIVERIALSPWARRQGVGLRVIQILLRNWQSGCSLAVIKPFPLQGEPDASEAPETGKYDLGSLSEDMEEGTRKLARYYGRLGFKAVAGCPYLVRSTDEISARTTEIDLPDHLLVPSGIVKENE